MRRARRNNFKVIKLERQCYRYCQDIRREVGVTVPLTQIRCSLVVRLVSLIAACTHFFEKVSKPKLSVESASNEDSLLFLSY